MFYPFLNTVRNIKLVANLATVTWIWLNMQKKLFKLYGLQNSSQHCLQVYLSLFLPEGISNDYVKSLPSSMLLPEQMGWTFHRVCMKEASTWMLPLEMDKCCRKEHIQLSLLCTTTEICKWQHCDLMSNRQCSYIFTSHMFDLAKPSHQTPYLTWPPPFMWAWVWH